MTSGYCKQCPEYYTPDTSRPKCDRQCVKVICGDNEIVHRDGRCESCGEYQKVSDDGLRCKELPRCGARQYRITSGECRTCLNY